MPSRSTHSRTLFAAIATTVLLSGCSAAEISDGINAAKQVAKERASVAGAESLRLLLLENASKQGKAYDDVTFVRTTAAQVWGVQFTVNDIDNDGKVDSGTVEAAVADTVACLVLPTATSSGEARSGNCITTSSTTTTTP